MWHKGGSHAHCFAPRHLGRSSRLRRWLLLQQIVFPVTQTAPETGLEAIATANADGSDVQQVTITPAIDY